MRRVGKWLLIAYIVQAVIGSTIGIAVAVIYGDKAEQVLMNVSRHLEEVANGTLR